MKSNRKVDIPSIAEIQVSYKPITTISRIKVITKSKDAYQLFLETWDEGKLQFVEQFRMMLLNRANRVIGICTVTSGTSTACIADPRLIFGIALKANASNIIVAHNHPSGNLQPSKIDDALTLRLREGARLLDLKLFDHLIISAEGYYSYADEGAM